MNLNNIALNNAQILIPVKDFTDTIKGIFEDVLKSQDISFSQQTAIKDDCNNDLLTRKQIAEILNISLPTLDLRIKDGIIPAYRIGKKLMFDKTLVLQSILKVGRNK